MIFISYFNYCVIRTVWQNMTNLRTSGNNTALLQNRNKSNRRVMPILLAITIAFFVLVFPNRIINIIINIIDTGNMSDSVFRTVKYFALFPYLFHISVNSLIYSFIDKKFRDHLIKLCNTHGRKRIKLFKKSISSALNMEKMVMTRVGKENSSTQQLMSE